MRNYNVILVFNPDFNKLLICKRSKEPYKGLRNLVGGKIEPGEDGLCAAYRELKEETGITARDIELCHLMDITYHMSQCLLEVYAGRLLREVEISGDENELLWAGLDENFFDRDRYAGEGNIGSMVAQALMHRDKLP